MYAIVYTKRASKDVSNLKSAKLEKKVKAFIDLLRENPFQSPPPFEKLVGDLQGACSRRINIQHRLVCQVQKDEKTVKIISMWTYYDI